jgi:hypothetical protein
VAEILAVQDAAIGDQHKAAQARLVPRPTIGAPRPSRPGSTARMRSLPALVVPAAGVKGGRRRLTP